MQLHIPNGGFFAACNPGENVHSLLSRLEDSGAQTLYRETSRCLFAAFPEFHGQGLWHSSEAVIAHDLDLTNEAELRRELQMTSNEDVPLGHLLWLLYRKYGADFVDNLRGQFAFALWDDTDERMLVATDFYGIRPVVYASNDKSLFAATRIRHLLHSRDVSREINEEAIYQYLFFEAIPTPNTIYKGISKLEPGTCLVYSNGDLRRKVYYDISYRPERNSDASYWQEKVFDQVKQAVSRYVPHSAPEKTGCYLSGGTDSSSISGLYTKLSGSPARTFSIGFHHDYYNELEYAHIASKHFGTEQHDYYVTPNDVMELLQVLPQLYDEPFGNSSVVPAFFCARTAANNGLVRLLGGDGGDEIFGGNERYVTNLIFEAYHKIPALARQKLLEPSLNFFPDKGIFYKAKRYVRRANIPNPERFYSYNLLAEVSPEEIFNQDFMTQVDPNCFLKLAQKHYDQAAPADVTDRLLYLDMKFTITDNDLRKVTQMAEAAGVRPQYPLLDRDLVDFTATIPPELKVKWKKNRYIFKRAMENFLPQEIIQKKKHGMGLPVAPWLKADPTLAELLQDSLFASKPMIGKFVRQDFLHNMKRAYQNDTTSFYGSNLWVFLVLELWLRHNDVEGI